MTPISRPVVKMPSNRFLAALAANVVHVSHSCSIIERAILKK